jgi:hypothetical protein
MKKFKRTASIITCLLVIIAVLTAPLTVLAERDINDYKDMFEHSGQILVTGLPELSDEFLQDLDFMRNFLDPAIMGIIVEVQEMNIPRALRIDIFYYETIGLCECNQARFGLNRHLMHGYLRRPILSDSEYPPELAEWYEFLRGHRRSAMARHCDDRVRKTAEQEWLRNLLNAEIERIKS